VHITAQGPPPRLRNDLYCVEWDVKLYYTIPLTADTERINPNYRIILLRLPLLW